MNATVPASSGGVSTGQPRCPIERRMKMALGTTQGTRDPAADAASAAPTPEECTEELRQQLLEAGGNMAAIAAAFVRCLRCPLPRDVREASAVPPPDAQ